MVKPPERKYGGLTLEEYVRFSVERDKILAAPGSATDGPEIAELCKRYGVTLHRATGAGVRAFVPEWQASLDVSWEWRDLFVNYGYNWFDETVRYEGRPDDWVDPRYVNYSARSTHDVQVRYNIDERTSVYGGVNNIGDQQPDRGLSDYPVGPLGRYFYLGVNMSL